MNVVSFPLGELALLLLCVTGLAPLAGIIAAAALLGVSLSMTSVIPFAVYFGVPITLLIFERSITREFLALKDLPTGALTAIAVGGVLLFEPGALTALLTMPPVTSVEVELLVVAMNVVAISFAAFATICLAVLTLEIPVRMALSQNKASVIPWEFVRFWGVVWFVSVAFSIIVDKVLTFLL